jgi:hypothetical protein
VDEGYTDDGHDGGKDDFTDGQLYLSGNVYLRWKLEDVPNPLTGEGEAGGEAPSIPHKESHEKSTHVTRCGETEEQMFIKKIELSTVVVGSWEVKNIPHSTQDMEMADNAGKAIKTSYHAFLTILGSTAYSVLSKFFTVGEILMDAWQLKDRVINISHVTGPDPSEISTGGEAQLNNEVIQPVTPNMLIIGKTTTALDFGNHYKMPRDKFTEQLALVEEVENERWKLWYPQCAAAYLPYHSAREALPRDNAQVGDICLLNTPAKFGTRKFQIGRITRVMPDNNGVVRTVEIEMRPRNARETLLPYKSKVLVRQTVTIQRLVLLYRKGETDEIKCDDLAKPTVSTEVNDEFYCENI